MSKSYTTLGCYGTNPRTGRKVGRRHRWPHAWGLGRCIWCHRYIDEVRREDKPAAPAPGSEVHLAQALRSTA